MTDQDATSPAPASKPGEPGSRLRHDVWHDVWHDIRRMAAISAMGCALLAVFELGAALVTTPAPDVRLITALRLVLIDATLVALLWAVLVWPLATLAALAARLALFLHDHERGLTWPGLLAGKHREDDRMRPLAAWLWALALGALVYVSLGTYVAWRVFATFREPQLAALLVAALHLGLVGFVGGLVYVLGRSLAWLGARLHARLGKLSPLGSVPVAGLGVVALNLGVLKLAAVVLPHFAPVLPWRHLVALVVLCVGCHGATRILARRKTLFPGAGKARRMAMGTTALAAILIIPLTLTRVGADHEAKSVAMTGSPMLASLVDFVRKATDVDRDEYGFFLGENDCAPLDRAIHPLARDIPDNGIDEDCNGRDFSFKTPPKYQKGERVPVPAEFQKTWNILLITVDTVRYDHTSFGGYVETRRRDTTPNLARLVDRSVSFTFANAPSAGTMASVPAILTSKFFHSGIALDENVKPHTPPRLKPENVLIAELLKQRGYYNGAILSHDYFKDWGMQQGFDTYDNELGKTRAPQAITSHEITDKAIAWIGRNSKRDKWFLWAHYIDPHGRYVAHPGDRSFGDTEEDLYDGELYYADKHLGRLFRELASMPGADRTIIIITSDHGDAFNEHGFINHGQALYRELLHVPLIVHVPGLYPRTVDGAVSPLDIVPTLCDLAGVDTSGLAFEGESLVPQLFYNKDAHERVVFAETNFPKPIRAAITSKHKLIYKLKDNVYEFYDLVADPWEKRNIYNQADKEALGRMKEYLDEWLERVYYARDTLTNQFAANQLTDHVLDKAPQPRVRIEGIAFDGGRIEVMGMDTDKEVYRPRDKLRVAVYFHVKERPSGDFRLQAEAWIPSPPDKAAKTGSSLPRPDAGVRREPDRTRPAISAAVQAAHSPPRLTADGLFPSSRWRAGEYVRDRFEIQIPASFRPDAEVSIGLRMLTADRRTSVPVTGPTRPGDQGVAVLGKVALEPAPTPEPGKDAGPGTTPPGQGAAPGPAPAPPGPTPLPRSPTPKP